MASRSTEQPPSSMLLSLRVPTRPRRLNISIRADIRSRPGSHRVDRIPVATRSRVMAGVRSRRTQPERQVESLLRLAGVRHLRRNFRGLPGCPDFVIRSARIAIFVDSCFWHGCRWHHRRPASRQEYWDAKIERNAARDRLVNGLLKRMNWRVIRIWEHQIRDSTGRAKVIARVAAALTGVGADASLRVGRCVRAHRRV